MFAIHVHRVAAVSVGGSLSYQFSLMKVLVTTSSKKTAPTQFQARSTRKMGSDVRHNCQTIPTETFVQSRKAALFGLNDGSTATTWSRTGSQKPQGRVVL